MIPYVIGKCPHHSCLGRMGRVSEAIIGRLNDVQLSAGGLCNTARFYAKMVGDLADSLITLARNVEIKKKYSIWTLRSTRKQ